MLHVLSHNTKFQITIMKFDYTDMRGSIEDLPACIVNFPTEEIWMNGSQLRAGDIKKFVDGFLRLPRENIKLRKLRLSHNTLDPGDFQSLSELVNHLGGMDELDVTHCRLTDESVESFFNTVRKKINILHLSKNNHISPQGMESVRGIVEKCCTKELHMNVCCLTEDHLDRLLKSSSKLQIRTLSLNGNINLTPEIVVQVGNSCGTNKLYIRQCELSTDEVKEIKTKSRCQVFADGDDENEKKVEKESSDRESNSPTCNRQASEHFGQSMDFRGYAVPPDWAQMKTYKFCGEEFRETSPEMTSRPSSEGSLRGGSAGSDITVH